MYHGGEADIIVIGAGHAGCEAALSTARLGYKTILFAISLDSLAMMPCNPNIGGTSKGHLVREIDALGGEMGKNIDKSFIQSKMLNKGKGPAVHSLRAQADKLVYTYEMRKVIENTPNLYLKQGEIVDIDVVDGKVKGVIDLSGGYYQCKSVILCCGTYLKAKCLYGDTVLKSGPQGLKASVKLRDSLKNLGIQLDRFKTGTPARIDKRSLDFSKMTEQKGDEKIVPFSFENIGKDLSKEQVSCYLTYTNPRTHEIIRNNLHRSPMHMGVIEGTGTRYCPSIEDKITRFSDKDRHQTFVEPEGLYTNEMYIQGISSALPFDVQMEMYRSIEGFENCEIMRPAYAIEYDCIDATQLKLNLELKSIQGLFSAGQFNGSSGYEEAAAQGLIAGINACQYLKGEAPVVLKRSDAYIGVLIDDLVTKGTKEPYRMMTSRSEYRLLLRQDNADLRLTDIGYQIGLIHKKRYEQFLLKKEMINEEIKRVKKVIVPPNVNNIGLLNEYNSTPIKSGAKLAELIKRPELSYEITKAMDINRPSLTEEVTEQVNIQIKYEGYIKKQIEQVEHFTKLEKRKLPENLDYSEIYGLRLEAVAKLNGIKPMSVGQAGRITGVSPADITVLLIYLEQKKRRG